MFVLFWFGGGFFFCFGLVFFFFFPHVVLHTEKEKIDQPALTTHAGLVLVLKKQQLGMKSLKKGRVGTTGVKDF